MEDITEQIKHLKTEIKRYENLVKFSEHTLDNCDFIIDIKNLIIIHQKNLIELLLKELDINNTNT